MRVARFTGRDPTPFWGLITGDSVRRLGGPMTSWAPLVALDQLDGLDLSAPVALDSLRLLAPVDSGARVLGVGANYRAHLQRLGVTEMPTHPVAFIKPHSALTDPGGVIRYPSVTEQLDYEIELVVVCSGSAEDPLLGFTVGNDVSARDARGVAGVDLFGMKCLDQTTPVGPWIATSAEVGTTSEPQLDLELRVNGEVRQSDNTRNMVFGVREILDYLDARVKLRCGDVIFTGTTCGVGLEDGRFLQPGDVVEAEIARIGLLRNSVGYR